MKQIIQSLRSGELSVEDVAAPETAAGHVLVANAASVVSAGTEKMVLDVASRSLLGKARERPDQVRRVLEKLRNEGPVSTLRAVNARLDEPMSMGYASTGGRPRGGRRG